MPDPAPPDAQESRPTAAARTVQGTVHQRLERLQQHPPPPRTAPAPANGTRPLRMVLDTNVSLDLIVFRDPRWADLARGIAGGLYDALMRADCRAEFARVLGYPQFELDAARRVDAMASFDAMHRFPMAHEHRAGPVDGLPQCRDPDDQKFVELAYLARADVLLSKDKALLKLGRRLRRMRLFEIVSPQHWLEAGPAAAPGHR